MSIYRILKQFTLTGILLAAPVMAQTPYEDGQKALREQHWTEAAEHFEQAIETDKSTADASMYWRAHALYKAGREHEAKRQLKSLGRKYPRSEWLKEAQVLLIEHEDAEKSERDKSHEAGLDEELRMFALARLMERDTERALPLVLELLRDSKSDSVRRDALFILGMSEEPEAQKAIVEFARDSGDTDLQIDAIHMLGAAGTESSLALLAGLYTGEPSAEVKEAIIHAYVAGDEVAPLLDILKTEQNSDLQREIIYAMGAMDATVELQTLYPTFKDRKSKIAALEAFSIAGNLELLREVLATEKDPELRKTAIYGIAMSEGEDAAEFMQSHYTSAQSKEEKKAVLESLVMMDSAGELALTILRTESDTELQHQAVEVLGIMGATAELSELYANLEDQETRIAVIEAMAIADDTQGLNDLLRTEQGEELRIAVIQALAISGDKEVGKNLVTLYPEMSHEEKTAVIEYMMILDDAPGLLGLLKRETNSELKREMLQMLMVIDSEETDQYLFDLLENKG